MFEHIFGDAVLNWLIWLLRTVKAGGTASKTYTAVAGYAIAGLAIADMS